MFAAHDDHKNQHPAFCVTNILVQSLRQSNSKHKIIDTVLPNKRFWAFCRVNITFTTPLLKTAIRLPFPCIVP